VKLIRSTAGLFWGLLLSGCLAERPKTALETVIIEGRALETGDGIRLSFPGSSLTFKTCDETTSKFAFVSKESSSEDLGLDVLRDGKLSVPVMGADGMTVEYSNPHAYAGQEFKFIRRNEAWQGDIIFLGAEAPGGFCHPNPPSKIKLLFIGDSITAGAGTTSRLNDDGEREAVSNARLAYPRVLGDRLNAQVHHVAYGGRGLVRDWQGITDTNNAPQFYDRVLPDDPDYLWDPQNYQADIVSVMLGTNDFNLGIPDRESWTQVYKEFVSRIRTDYPKAQIFLISSPMTGGEKGEALNAYVKEVADGFGTPSVQYLEVSQYYGEAWDSHPTAAEHQKIADELEAAFRGALSK